MDRAGALARLTSMVAAAERPALSGDDLDTLLDDAAVPDMDGHLVVDAAWVPTWDLNAAASAGWSLKAARVAGDFTFSVDGASYSKGDVMARCLDMAQHYAAKAPLGYLTLAQDRSYGAYDSPRLVL